jgi:hypothetical protein
MGDCLIYFFFSFLFKVAQLPRGLCKLKIKIDYFRNMRVFRSIRGFEAQTLILDFSGACAWL